MVLVAKFRAVVYVVVVRPTIGVPEETTTKHTKYTKGFLVVS
jgi:hypothetical protein